MDLIKVKRYDRKTEKQDDIAINPSFVMAVSKETFIIEYKPIALTEITFGNGKAIYTKESVEEIIQNLKIDNQLILE